MILEQARGMHWAACREYEQVRDARLAMPFGTPYDMPPHVWRVSRDVLQALYEASPSAVGPNPKSGDDGTTRLFGWLVVLDSEAPNGTMRLELDAAERMGRAIG